jgi:SAM-dependent methyltransferase
MIARNLQRLAAVVNDPSYREWLFNKTLAATGFDHRHWSRVVHERAWRAWFAARPIAQWDALEISPANTATWRLPFRSYSSTQFPAFDICTSRLDRQFDVVIADQIWEHLAEPEAAARNVLAMLKPGGYFVIATPFMIRVHGAPDDYSRWTQNGLRRLLASAGFGEIATDQWGNRKFIAAHLRLRTEEWAIYGWGKDLSNDPEHPVQVWAFARKPA